MGGEAMVDTRRCVVCGRRYAGNAKPHWAFDRAGRLVGTAHTGCTLGAGASRGYRFGDRVATPLDRARALVWLRQLRPRPAGQSVAWWAGHLFEVGQGLALNDRQQELLSYWGAGALALDTRPIRARYQELVAEYAAWCAALGVGEAP